MKIQLIDHKVETEVTSWGTCEICASVGEFDFAKFMFRHEDGDEYWVEGWEMEPWYGPVSSIHIDNLFDFAAWLNKKEFPNGSTMTYEKLAELSRQYNRELDAD